MVVVAVQRRRLLLRIDADGGAHALALGRGDVERNYDISKSEIELLINVCWSGEPILKDDNAYQTNKTKMRMILNNVEKCNNKEMFSWDYINKVFIKYIKLDNKEFICFASDEQDPVIYIVCESIKYEEIKDN